MRFLWILLPLGLYLLANGLIAWRGFKLLTSLAPRMLYSQRWIWAGRLWVVLILFFMAAPFLSRFLEQRFSGVLPDGLIRALSWLGYDWLVLCMIGSVLLLLIEGLFIFLQKGFVFQSDAHIHGYRIILVILLLGAYAGWGTYCALSTKWTSYEVVIQKEVPGISQIKTVFVSDLHLGDLIRLERLQGWVDEINAKNPDLILFGGDIFDSGTVGLGADEAAYQQVFAELSAPLGVYTCMGNHDGGWGLEDRRKENLTEWLKAAGIELLLNRYVIAEGIVIAGKEYYWNEAEDRAALGFLEEAPKEQPVILLDHKPGYLADTAAAGVDLTLAGHTHRGQVWPGNIITGLMYETDYGYQTNGESQIIVSCGAGTWGPVLRVGSRSELVEITLRFEPAE